MGYSSRFSLLPLEGGGAQRRRLASLSFAFGQPPPFGHPPSMEGGISHRVSRFSPERGDLLSKFLAEVVEDFLARLFYIVDERDIFGRYDVAERKGAGLFVDDTGDEAVGLCEKVEGLGFAGRIIGFTDVGNLLQVGIVPFDGIEMVEGHARGEDIDVREAFVIDGFFNDVDKVLAIDGIGLRNEGGAGCDGHGWRIERGHRVAVRGGLGDEALGGGRRGLAFGEAVDLIVKDEVGDVHISLHRMHGMAETDGVGVAVAGADDHMGVLVCTLDALCEGKGSAVGGMSAVAVLVAADTGRAADAGDQGDVFIRPAFFRADSADGILNAVVAAAGAPVRNNGIFIVAR